MSNPPENKILGPRPPKPVIECKQNNLNKALGTFSKDANRSIPIKKTKNK